MKAKDEQQRLAWLALLPDIDRVGAIQANLLEKYPGLAPITAIVMAGDLLSAEKATAALAAGEPWARVRNLVGSYARLEWTVAQQEAGYMTRADLLEDWPALWRGSDPDDTDPRWLALWREAAQRNLGTVLDGQPLPAQRVGPRLPVFRGQMPNDPVGMAWSTDREVAVRFALTGRGRSFKTGGVVLHGLVKPRAVLAYLTGRDEQEVIADPADVEIVKKEVL